MNETLTLSEPLTVTTKKEITWKEDVTKGYKALTLPANTKVEVRFATERPNRLYVSVPGMEAGRRCAVVLRFASEKFTGIQKMPSMKTLEKYSFDGIAKTVTGHRTEPDGTGPDGSPSWLLVAGVI